MFVLLEIGPARRGLLLCAMSVIHKHEQVSVRGVAMATGSWGGWPDGGKATVGVLWHMS